MNEDLINLLLESPKESRELLRTSLLFFIKTFHFYLFRKDFIFKPFHLRIIDKLEGIVFDNKSSKNLAIAISPRCGKSQLVKYFIAWYYTVLITNNVIYTSYSDKLIMKFSAEIRDIIECKLYYNLFGIKLKKDTTSKALWQLQDGGQLMASPIGGSITGFGADVLVIDDPMKADDFKSQTARENVVDFYVGTLKSRLDNQETGRKILIMQRLHKEDLFGWLLINEKDEWDFIEIPAIDEDGASIFPEKLPLEYLNSLKRISPYTFQSQYMQQPISLGGNLIKTEWFKRYTTAPIKFDNLFITCDTASSTKTSADNSAFGLFGVKDGDLYLLDMMVGKWDFPTLKSNLKSFYEKAKSKYTLNILSAIYIESKSSGTSLIQELKAIKLPVQAIFPTVTEKDKEVQRDKYWRAQEVLSDIADGYVFIPETAYWLTDFIDEVESFTGLGDTHDDRVDVLLYALKIRRKKRVINWEETANAIQRYF